MIQNSSFEVMLSLTDFPIFTTLEYMFAGLKKTSVDSLELVPGLKS